MFINDTWLRSGMVDPFYILVKLYVLIVVMFRYITVSEL